MKNEISKIEYNGYSFDYPNFPHVSFEMGGIPFLEWVNQSDKKVVRDSSSQLLALFEYDECEPIWNQLDEWINDNIIFLMHPESGDIMTRDQWRSDYESTDKELWFGKDQEEITNDDLKNWDNKLLTF